MDRNDINNRTVRGDISGEVCVTIYGVLRAAGGGELSETFYDHEYSGTHQL